MMEYASLTLWHIKSIALIAARRPRRKWRGFLRMRPRAPSLRCGTRQSRSSIPSTPNQCLGIHSLFAPIAQVLDAPLVPYARWLYALYGSVERGSAEEVGAMRLNPALRLLSFYEAQTETTGGAQEREAMGLVFIATDKAVRVSEPLARLTQLDGERAMMWLAGWKKSGFLSC